MMSGLLPPLSSRTSTMSHPTCCCSVSLDRCDRCDLLVDLEGFHLMSAVRTPDALVLDVESCNQLAGCPDCGVIAQGHGRVVVEVIDAPWAGVPVRIRWHKRRWICREHTCQITTFAEQNHSVCAPRARLGVRAIRWAIRQLRFEGATIAGLARQQPRGIPCGPISSRVCKPHLMTPPVSQGCGCWGLTSTCGTTRTDADEGPVSSPASST